MCTSVIGYSVNVISDHRVTGIYVCQIWAHAKREVKCLTSLSVTTESSFDGITTSRLASGLIFAFVSTVRGIPERWCRTIRVRFSHTLFSSLDILSSLHGFLCREWAFLWGALGTTSTLFTGFERKCACYLWSAVFGIVSLETGA